MSLLQDFYLNPQESDIDAWKKLGPSASAADLKRFISAFPESVMLDAARARLDAIENASERERLAREYADKESRLRRDLEAAEAGYKKAMSELSERREREEREQLAETKANQILPQRQRRPGNRFGQRPGSRRPLARRQRARAGVERTGRERQRRGTGCQRTGCQGGAGAVGFAGAAYEADKARLGRRAADA